MKNYLYVLVTTCCITLLLSCSNKSELPAEFQIEKGFQLELIAKEPLIKDPVDLEFNERGEAMVLEMPGYPFEDKQSRIVILKDLDNNGEYDEVSVFAENLQLASSFLPYKEGVLVAAPPYLLYVKDLDNDHKADAVDTLMGGFSTGNLQHNYNGLTLGLDNWIYAANGGNDGKPFWWNDTTSSVDLRGQDFRINLETRTLQRLGESSGGFGLAMSEYGHIYETHNLEHISHLVFPDRYIKETRLMQENTLDNISDHEENGLARIYPIGEQESRVNHPEQSGYFSGSCGITYYGGGAFGPEYNHTIWVADVVLNLIHVDKISPQNSSHVASRVMEKRDFLASSDRSFRPVNMAVGPDGSMYVVDMYRKVIEHPEWIPDEIEKTLDLEAGKDKGRIYRISKTGVTNDFDVTQFNSHSGMIKALTHTNQWVRRTAHRLLGDASVNEPAYQELYSLLSSENEYARLHAMWILSLKGKLSIAQLVKLLTDNTPGIRENALIIAEQHLDQDQEVFRNCKMLLGDKDSRVRMQAALSLSTMRQEQFAQRKKELFDAIIEATENELDDWNIAAVTLIVQDAAPELFTRLLHEPVTVNPMLLASLAQASNQHVEDMVEIMKELSVSNLSNSVCEQIVYQLSKSTTKIDGKQLKTYIEALEKRDDKELLSQLAALRNRTGLSPSPQFIRYSAQALRQVTDNQLPDSVRLKQMALIELLPYKEKSEVLYQCLENTQPLKLQEDALRQLSKIRDPEVGWRIVKIWKELGPQSRRYASDILLYNETNHQALLTGLEQGAINIGEMNFDLERRRMLLWWTDNEDTKKRAEKLFSDSGVTNRKDAIEKMKPSLLLQGSAENGRKVFESICSNCHVYGSIGRDVGPVLTEINRKSKESIMHDVLDPNAAADTKYINHRLETRNGELHMGIVESETDQYITIKKMGGEKVTVSKSDIKTFQSLGTSLMMEGLENSMTLQEMADLLEFLQNPQ